MTLDQATALQNQLSELSIMSHFKLNLLERQQLIKIIDMYVY
jgi:hypothetical protein